MKKNNQSLLSRFFSHNITLLVLAFILAFAAWFIISLSEESVETKTITDIPVTIELPDTAMDDGLILYGTDDLKASVEVKGNRAMLGTLTASDIQVTANQSSSMISVGSYTLSLTAKQAGLKTNYTIVKEKLSPSTVTVYVDKNKEQEFNIDNQITVNLDDSNHYASVALSKSKVTVSGPETHVNQIASVAVVDNISTDTQTTVNKDLVFFDDCLFSQYVFIKDNLQKLQALEVDCILGFSSGLYASEDAEQMYAIESHVLHNACNRCIKTLEDANRLRSSLYEMKGFMKVS